MGFKFNPFTGTLDVVNASSSGGGAVDSVAASNSTLTISPTTGDVLASINLSNANTWLADQSVPDEAYGVGWNGSLEVPTKNAVYDKINSLVSGVSSVSNADGTLTISPTTGAVIASVDQSFNFAWLGAHTWGGVISIDASSAIQLNVNSNFTVDDGGAVVGNSLALTSGIITGLSGAGILELGAGSTRLADDNGLVLDGGLLTFQVLGTDVFTHDGITANFLTDLTSAGIISAVRFLAGDLGGLDTSQLWVGSATGQASGRINSPDDEAYITITSAQVSGTAKGGLLLADHGTFLGSIVGDGSDSNKLKFFTGHPSTPSSLALWFDHSTNVATFEADVNVPDEAYGISWNGSLEVPTKNAVYDKIQTLSGGSFAMTETEVDFGTTPQWGKTFTVTDAAVTGASKISAWPSGNVATSRVGNDNEWDMVMYTALAGTGSFTLTAHAFPGPIVGKRKVYYAIA